MTRLSEQQLQALKDRAALFQKRLVQVAKRKVPQEGTNQGAFFAVLFQLAAAGIEDDVEGFCDLAEQIFEEIEAHGQEPLLSEDWLSEVTGEKDNFYFSTENLVSDLISPQRKKRHKKVLTEQERERLRQEVEAAVIDNEPLDVEQALTVAHGENVEGWIMTIEKAFIESQDSILEFWDLRKKTGLQAAELFLGLLLGQEHWILGQDTFYDKVLVERKKGKRKQKEGEEK